MFSIGVMDGADTVFIWGLGKKIRRLKTRLSKQGLTDKARSVMRDMGRGLVLAGQPETAACLMGYRLTRPCVLACFWLEDVPIVGAWSARGLTGWISRRRALSSFIKKMGSNLEVSDEKAPVLPDDKKKKKEEKKAKKAEEKRKKQEEKEALQAEREELKKERERMKAELEGTDEEDIQEEGNVDGANQEDN